MLSSESNSARASVFASSVLPTPVGPRKMNAADGPARILDPGAGADHRVGHRLHRLVLTDHPFVQESSRRSSFSRSPSTRRVTGMPVHRETISATSASVTSSRSRRSPLRRPSRTPPPLPRAALELRAARRGELGRSVEVVGPLGLVGLTAGAFDLFAQVTHVLDGLLFVLPLGAHGGLHAR
jgi:hypothetical protein